MLGSETPTGGGWGHSRCTMAMMLCSHHHFLMFKVVSTIRAFPGSAKGKD